MRLNPKLLRELEKRGDANAVLAEALGVCPACGQPRPKGKVTPSIPRKGEKKDQIRGWHQLNPSGSQSECARAIGCSVAYVGRVWQEAARDEADE